MFHLAGGRRGECGAAIGLAYPLSSDQARRGTADAAPFSEVPSHPGRLNTNKPLSHTVTFYIYTVGRIHMYEGIYFFYNHTLTANMFLH